MKIHYRYLFNTQKDEAGRFTGFIEGYRPGDELTFAYGGEFESEKEYEDDWAEELFVLFNQNECPNHYRGPSMSVGSVVQLSTDGIEYKTLSVGIYGWFIADISQSITLATPDRWMAL